MRTTDAFRTNVSYIYFSLAFKEEREGLEVVSAATAAAIRRGLLTLE